MDLVSHGRGHTNTENKLPPVHMASLVIPKLLLRIDQISRRLTSCDLNYSIEETENKYYYVVTCRRVLIRPPAEIGAEFQGLCL